MHSWVGTCLSWRMERSNQNSESTRHYTYEYSYSYLYTSQVAIGRLWLSRRDLQADPEVGKSALASVYKAVIQQRQLDE